MAITASIISFHELTSVKLYELLALRQSVFIIEQQCLYHDIDNNDQKAQHVLIEDHDRIIAYARILPIDHGSISFGRVLTAPSHRGQGFAKQLVAEIIAYLNSAHPKNKIIIEAQLYLQPFYQQFGFHAINKPFDLDGIPHIEMMKCP